MKPEERVKFRKEMKNKAEGQPQKPVSVNQKPIGSQQKPVQQKPVQQQKVKVEKVKKTHKGLVISFTKA